MEHEIRCLDIFENLASFLQLIRRVHTASGRRFVSEDCWIPKKFRLKMKLDSDCLECADKYRIMTMEEYMVSCSYLPYKCPHFEENCGEIFQLIPEKQTSESHTGVLQDIEQINSPKSTVSVSSMERQLKRLHETIVAHVHKKYPYN